MALSRDADAAVEHEHDADESQWKANAYPDMGFLLSSFLLAAYRIGIL